MGNNRTRHGGNDPGASGNGIIEKNLNLDISKYMYEQFKKLGIPVALTRDSDITLSPTERTNKILSLFGNDPNVIVISNHINAGGGEGAEVIYALRNNSSLADLVLENLEKSGQVVRETYQRRLPSNPSKDYYFIHRDTGKTQPIIVEYGFLDTKADADRLKTNYTKYAQAVVDAVAEYLDLSYQKETGENIYTVSKGDSLYSIAKKFNVTLEELKLANNLSSNLIDVGQKLIIPIKEEPIEGEYTIYTVKSGDSLYSIANEYKTTVSELIDYNNLSSTNLKIGQQLLIPTKKTEPSKSTDDYIRYTVVKGDSLYSIATKYGVTVNDLKALNNLTTNNLSVNNVLLIPKKETEGNIYTVKSGDSLYSIAKKYNTTVNELKRLNNLTSNLLSLNQTLIVPTFTTNTYVVKSGDNLYSIANKFNTTVDNIKTKNNLTSNLLSIGQVLLV